MRTALCQYRKWPGPHYFVLKAQIGFTCEVYVDNVCYRSGTTPWDSELRARDVAGMVAFIALRKASTTFAARSTLRRGETPIYSKRRGMIHSHTRDTASEYATTCHLSNSSKYYSIMSETTTIDTFRTAVSRPRSEHETSKRPELM